MMVLDLPEADRTPLASSPLELVVCQVRYDETLSASEGRVILGVHKDLGGRVGMYERAESVKASSIEITLGGLGGLESPNPLSGWRLVSGDGAWTATVMPDSTSLETIAYSSWDDFRPRLEQLVGSVARQVEPTLVQRLGLRYVNRLVLPEVESPRDWQPFVAPELLGPIRHTILGERVQSTMQQVALELGSGVRATLRHGSMTDTNLPNNIAYLLDYDIFHQTPTEFDVESILENADQFNEVALRLFHQTVTPELVAQLRRVGRDGSE